MIEIAVILLAAAVVFGIARATGLPAIPLLILAGLGLTTMQAIPDREFVLSILEVGLAFLVFAAGMDMSPGRVGKQADLALKVGLMQFFALAGLAAWLTLRTGFGLEESLYVALAISASSTLVVVRVLKSRQELFESFGRMIIGVLLLQDLLVIGAIVLLRGLAKGDTVAMVGVFETTLLLVLAALLLGKFVFPRVVNRYKDEEETLLLIVLSVLFAFMGLAYLGDVPAVVAAFLAGLSLSSFPARSLVRGLITSLTDFFMVIFFIALGALVTLPPPDLLLDGIFLILLVLVVTPLLVAFVAEKAGMTSRGALEAGLLLAQTSEFSLIVGLVGLESGQISEDLFGMLVLVTVVTMIATPMLSSRPAVTWLMRFHPNPGPKNNGPDRAQHVVVIGGGTGGSLLYQRFRAADVPVVIVDNDPMVVSHYLDRNCDAVWGDGEDHKVLEEAGIADARAVIITTGKLHHLKAVLQLRPEEAPVWFHAFEESQSEAAAELGARTVTYSEAAAENFMKWFQGREGSGMNHSKRTSPGVEA